MHCACKRYQCTCIKSPLSLAFRGRLLPPSTTLICEPYELVESRQSRRNFDFSLAEFQSERAGSNFVANAEATSVDESQQCDILPEPACRELSDGTKVNWVFIARNSTCLCVMTNFGAGPFRRGAFNLGRLEHILYLDFW